jgi:putative resolvase
MKLSVWAKQQGISYRTAWNWFKAGKLPIPSIQTKTGTILVDAPITKQETSKLNYDTRAG